MYLVVACPRCRRARVVEQGKKTTQCGSCGRSLVLQDLRAHFLGDGFEEASAAAGMLNARLAGREEEFLAALVPAPSPAARHDDAYGAAAAAARKANSEKDRADAVARALSARMVDFGEQDLARAFEMADLKGAEKHLARMLATQVVFEPRSGRYAAL